MMEIIDTATAFRHGYKTEQINGFTECSNENIQCHQELHRANCKSLKLSYVQRTGKIETRDYNTECFATNSIAKCCPSLQPPLASQTYCLRTAAMKTDHVSTGPDRYRWLTNHISTFRQTDHVSVAYCVFATNTDIAAYVVTMATQLDM